jgi:hypothetical protein
MLLIRFLLISLIVYLIVRSFVRYSDEEKPPTPMSEPEKRNDLTNKKISKKIGEYIEYEEVDKKK